MLCFVLVVLDQSMNKYWLLHYKFLVVSFKNISQQNNEHEYIYVHMYNTVGKYFSEVLRVQALVGKAEPHGRAGQDR